jgi:hypothetical protein
MAYFRPNGQDVVATEVISRGVLGIDAAGEKQF